MTNEAMAFADAANAGWNAGNVLHVYRDGYVLTLACGEKRRKLVRQVLGKLYPGLRDARSQYGFLVAFVVPYPCAEATDIPAGLAFLADGWTDHRGEDYDTIAAAAELVNVLE